jgi:hypothetical protein
MTDTSKHHYSKELQACFVIMRHNDELIKDLTTELLETQVALHKLQQRVLQNEIQYA